MPTKVVSISADNQQAASGADAGTSGLGMVGALVQSFNALLRLMANMALSAAAVAIATVTTQVKTTATFTYLISGLFKTKAATDPFWTVAILQAATGFANIPIGSAAMFLFMIDAAGVATVIEGPVGVGANAPAVPADSIPEDRAIVGTCKVVGVTAAFLAGTDNWNKAGVTFTFGDGYDASLVGAYRITTRV